jgi:hypothetical protein
VPERGNGQADVTEGSRGVWERLHDDWSDPHRITMTTTDSNIWGGRSGHTCTLTRRPDGTTDVDAVVVREGKNLKGRLLAIVVGTGGKRVLGKGAEQDSQVHRGPNYGTETCGTRLLLQQHSVIAVWGRGRDAASACPRPVASQPPSAWSTACSGDGRLRGAAVSAGQWPGARSLISHLQHRRLTSMASARREAT